VCPAILERDDGTAAAAAVRASIVIAAATRPRVKDTQATHRSSCLVLRKCLALAAILRIKHKASLLG
jgi:hypothetical protein